MEGLMEMTELWITLGTTIGILLMWGIKEIVWYRARKRRVKALVDPSKTLVKPKTEKDIDT